MNEKDLAELLLQLETTTLPANVETILQEHRSVDYEQGLTGGEANEAHRNRGVLIDVVRVQQLRINGLKRQLAGLQTNIATLVEEKHRLQQRVDEKRADATAIKGERDRLRGEGENLTEKVRIRDEALAHSGNERMVGERAVAREQARVAVLNDALQRYRRILCPEARIVGQTEAGVRLDVDEWEKEHASEFPLPRL